MTPSVGDPEARAVARRAFDAAREAPLPADRGTAGSLLATVALASTVGVAVAANLLGFALPGAVAVAVYGGLGALFTLGVALRVTRRPREAVYAERAEAALGDLVALDAEAEPRRALEAAARLLACARPPGIDPGPPVVDAAEMADRAGDALGWLELAERLLVAEGRAEPLFTALAPLDAAGDTVFDLPPVGEVGDTLLGVPPLSPDDAPPR